MHLFKLVKSSANVKTGNIPQTYTDKQSCPPSCGAFDGCYAKQAHTNIHWNKADKSYNELIAFIKNMPRNQLWRHNVAGDLMGIGEEIDTQALDTLVKANKGKKGFTYTHKKSNIQALKLANSNGFTINLSCDNVAEVGKYFKLGLPVVAISSSLDKVEYFDGVKMVRCPAEYNDKTDCVKCQLCAIPNRAFGIKFTAHGTAKKRIIPIIQA